MIFGWLAIFGLVGIGCLLEWVAKKLFSGTGTNRDVLERAIRRSEVIGSEEGTESLKSLKEKLRP